VPKSSAAERRERRLAHALAALSRDIRRELQRALGKLGLDVRVWTNLAFLHERPNSSNAELSRRLGVTPQGVHTVILRMERDGLIARHPDPNHGRISRFTLTERGQKVLIECDLVADEVEARVLEDLDAHERRALLSSVLVALRRAELPAAGSNNH
jgi:DNA-binding MarR family transcriptional regulator